MYDDRLTKIASDMYPGVSYPEVCWILEHVLKIDPKSVTINGFSLRGVEQFVFGMDGKRVYDEFYAPRLTFRVWTPEEREALEEWIDFIPGVFKGEYKSWTM